MAVGSKRWSLFMLSTAYTFVVVAVVSAPLFRMNHSLSSSYVYILRPIMIRMRDNLFIVIAAIFSNSKLTHISLAFIYTISSWSQLFFLVLFNTLNDWNTQQLSLSLSTFMHNAMKMFFCVHLKVQSCQLYSI